MPEIEISPNLFTRLTYLENEIGKLKQYLRVKIIGKEKTKKGLLKGVKIEEKDIEEAKKSLFKINY